MRRSSLVFAAAVAVYVAAGFPAAHGALAEAKAGNTAKPLNVIILLADDMGWGDLGCQGHPYAKTPAIDRLAATGCRFDQFYVSAPICSPSRAGLMTGRIQNRFGMQHLAGHEDFHHLPLNEPTLPRLLKEDGYATFHVGKWHLSSVGSRGEPTIAEYGFDHSLILLTGHYDSYFNSHWRRDEVRIQTKDRWSAEVYVDEAIKYIEQAGNRPFFLNLWSYAPHQENECAPQYRAMYADKTVNEQVYYGTITQMDEQYGRLLDYLDRTGLSENTIVIFTSDNGSPSPLVDWGHLARGTTGGLRGGKYSLYDGGIHLPGIIRWPGLTRPGSVSHEICWTPDILATICAAFGISLPQDMPFDGVDIRPALRGEKLARKEPLFWQHPFGNRLRDGTDPASPGLALRDGAWKLHCDLNFQRVELYNLELDRNEQSNVKDLNPEVTERLLEEMRVKYAEVNGPYSRTAKFINPQLPYKPKKELPAGRPWQLTCDSRHNPLGIDNPVPRLSWRVARDVPGGITQSAYQIVVASSIEKLGKAERLATQASSGGNSQAPDIWDSGKIASAQSTDIPYGGPPLHSQQGCYWKVRIWDGSGKAWDWSEVNSWEMGLMQPADWRAKRIGAGMGEAPAVYLRKTFTFTFAKPVKQARLYVSAEGRYEMHLNGERPGLDGKPVDGMKVGERGRYTTYDVTGRITNGTNVVGAILEKGARGEGVSLLAVLDIVDTKGEHLIIGTDESWQAAGGPAVHGGAESAAAATTLGDWDLPGYPGFPGYNASDWKQASVVAEPGQMVK